MLPAPLLLFPFALQRNLGHDESMYSYRQNVVHLEYCAESGVGERSLSEKRF